MNKINIIFPYKHRGSWVFDDSSKGLEKEAFVSGADDIMEYLSGTVGVAGKEFKLLFSDIPFLGYLIKFDWEKSEFAGNWYICSDKNLRGWLCPALLCYFDTPPKSIYIACHKHRVDNVDRLAAKEIVEERLGNVHAELIEIRKCIAIYFTDNPEYQEIYDSVGAMIDLTEDICEQLIVSINKIP